MKFAALLPGGNFTGLKVRPGRVALPAALGGRSASLEAKETRDEGKARNRMSEIRDQTALPFGVRTEVGGSSRRGVT